MDKGASALVSECQLNELNEAAARVLARAGPLQNQILILEIEALKNLRQTFAQ
jgi:hypothetical protein